MAYSCKREAYRISAFIDDSRYTHRELAKALDMKDWNFCDRYTGRVRWKTEELRHLAVMLGIEFHDLLG